MKIKYICTDCAKEISWSEYQHQSTIFCSECGGRIEEVAEDLARKNQSILPSTKHCPYCDEVNFSWKTICISCGKYLNEPKEDDISSVSATNKQIICQKCYKLNESSQKKCSRCGNDLEKSIQSNNISELTNKSNLIECPGCQKLISKRAEICPKCQTKLLEKCSICRNVIKLTSPECPICGDPYPFKDNPDAKKKDTSLLKSCPSCGCSISERASQCAHCGTSTNIPCEICGKIISCWSKICPECGDPEPFTEMSSKEIKNNDPIFLPPSQKDCEVQHPMTTKNASSSNHHLSWLFFSFDGRIGRKTFWCSYPFFLFFGLILSYLVELAKESNNINWLIFITVAAILFLWPSIAIQIKRWHDRNKSGNWILLNMIPIIGFFWVMFELGFLKGTKGNNIYGSDPVEK